MQIAPTLLDFRPLAPSFGAELSGMPVHGDVSDADLRAFVDALHRHRVLLLRNPGLDPGDLVAFSKRLGPLELHAAVEARHPAHPEIFCVGNVVRDGITANFARGVEQWHADSSYRVTSSDASLFYGEEVPPEGGETMFADATGAWDALDPATRQRIEGLRAVHSLETLYDWNRRHTPSRAPLSEEKRALWPPVSHPLVRTHPVTGAKSLYLCPAVISHIEGMDAAEGAALIEELTAHATAPRFVYSHRWRHGDLVIWDNRAVLHTASLFDHTRYQRLMFRTTLAGGALAA